MNATIKHLLAEAEFSGRNLFVIQIVRPDGAAAGDAEVRNLAAFIEGHLLPGGDVTTVPLIRESDRVIEIIVAVPPGVIDEPIALYSALERQAARFRSAEVREDGSCEQVYPILHDADAPAFALLAELDDLEPQIAVLEAEMVRAQEFRSRALDTQRRGIADEAQTRARLESVAERIEAIAARQRRLKSAQFAASGGWARRPATS